MYGARYLDPKYCRWLSTDPALGEYISGAGKANTKDAGNLPGMGGAFNHINFNLYHYAGNNPVRYVDPDGRENWFSAYIDSNSDYMTNQDKSILYSLNLIERAGNGDKGAQRILKDSAKEVAKESAVEGLEITANVSSVVADVTADLTIEAAVVQPEVAGGLGLTSEIASGIEVAARITKAALTENEKDIQKAKNSAVKNIGSLIVGKTVGEFSKKLLDTASTIASVVASKSYEKGMEKISENKKTQEDK